jgi:hypothetical protein
MTWKKTALNSHSKAELIDILGKTCTESNTTVSTADFYTNGTTFSELTKGKYNGWLTSGSNSQMPHILLGVLGGDKLTQDDFLTEAGMEKIAHCTRGLKESDYALVISPPIKDGIVNICAVGKRRVYMRSFELSGDEAHDISQVRYYAIYELTRLVFNEVKESIPINERGAVI